MSFIEILLIAVGLCFDTLAVSLVGGACLGDANVWKRAGIVLSFALFQAGFTFIGWLLGSTVSQYIEAFDHWVAFILLAYIGGKMVVEAFSKDEEKPVNLLDTGKLVVASIATSIDALAVGISFAMLHMPMREILFSVLVIGLVTALAAFIGLRGGERLGRLLGKKCNLIGGLILIGIGLKILLEHLLG